MPTVDEGLREGCKHLLQRDRRPEGASVLAYSMMIPETAITISFTQAERLPNFGQLLTLSLLDKSPLHRIAMRVTSPTGIKASGRSIPMPIEKRLVIDHIGPCAIT